MSFSDPLVSRHLAAFLWLSRLRAEVQIDPPETMSGDRKDYWRIWKAYEPGDAREVTGSGKTLLLAVENAVEEENRRRAVLKPHEIADALHAARPPNRVYGLAFSWRAPRAKKWEDGLLHLCAPSREEARSMVSRLVVLEACRGPFRLAPGIEPVVRYDLRRVALLGLTYSKKARASLRRS